MVEDEADEGGGMTEDMEEEEEEEEKEEEEGAGGRTKEKTRRGGISFGIVLAEIQVDAPGGVRHLLATGRNEARVQGALVPLLLPVEQKVEVIPSYLRGVQGGKDVHDPLLQVVAVASHASDAQVWRGIRLSSQLVVVEEANELARLWVGSHLGYRTCLQQLDKLAVQSVFAYEGDVS